MSNSLKSLFEYMTVNKRCKVIVGAYSVVFEESRIYVCHELVDNFESYDIIWVLENCWEKKIKLMMMDWKTRRFILY